MAANLIVNRTTTFFNDQDEIGRFDPEDVLYTRVTIQNNGDQNANNVTFEDNFTGTTLVAGKFNVSPIAFNDSFTAVANTVLTVGAAPTIGSALATNVSGNLLSNDRGSATLGTGVIVGDTVPGFQIDVVTNGVSVDGGRFNIFADGTFNYVNDGTDTEANLADGDSFTYTIRDAGFDGMMNTADDLTSTATVRISFVLQGASGSPVHRTWYVDPSAAPGGDGTSARPFQSLTALNGAAGAGDVDAAGHHIHVKGTVSGSIELESGQKLIGTGEELNVGGHLIQADGGANSAINAASGFAVTLSTNNTVAGVNLGGTGGITGTNFGTVTVTDDVVLNTSGTALSLTTGTFAGTGFLSTTSTGGANNVSLTSVAGTVALGGGALSGATAGSFVVSGGSVSTTYSGTLTQSAAGQNVISVSGGHSETATAGTGTLTFSGGINGGSGTGLRFDNADGIYNITGALTLTSGTSGIAIVNGSAGDFTFSNANNSISRNTSGGDAFVVSSSDANVSYNGSIGSNAFKAVNIDNHDAGTITFSGNGSIFGSGSGAGISVTNSNGGTVNFNTAITLSTSTSTAITLTNNNGSTTNFNPNGTGLDVTTSSGSGILANNAGTITITDGGTGNSITVTAGTDASTRSASARRAAPRSAPPESPSTRSTSPAATAASS
jgi:hypothetical protein